MKPVILLTSLSALVLSSCGVNQYGGGISDHGNERVAGVIIDRNGKAAAGVAVTILPDDYNPITDSTRTTLRETVTADDGSYAFDSLDSGVYTVSAHDRFSNTGCLVRNVATDSCESTMVDTLALTINGSIYFEVDSLALDVGYMVYLPGLSCYNVVDSTKIVNLFDIPTGRVALKAFDPSTGTTIELGDDYLCVEIIPGATLLLPSRSPKPYCVSNDSIVTCMTGRVGDVFTFSAIHPSKTISGNYIYRFSWGEGSISDWDALALRAWSWDRPGFYSVQTQIMRQGIYLAWSDPILIEIVER